VSAAPIKLIDGVKVHGMLKVVLLRGQVSAIAADEPITPANKPNTLYSMTMIKTFNLIAIVFNFC
jgi:hypothetical protein